MSAEQASGPDITLGPRGIGVAAGLALYMWSFFGYEMAAEANQPPADPAAVAETGPSYTVSPEGEVMILGSIGSMAIGFTVGDITARIRKRSH